MGHLKSMLDEAQRKLILLIIPGTGDVFLVLRFGSSSPERQGLVKQGPQGKRSMRSPVFTFPASSSRTHQNLLTPSVHPIAYISAFPTHGRTPHETSSPNRNGYCEGNVGPPAAGMAVGIDTTEKKLGLSTLSQPYWPRVSSLLFRSVADINANSHYIRVVTNAATAGR